jgi:hypothetical protein
VLDLVITHSNNITISDLEQLELQRLARDRTTSPTTKEVAA